MNHRISFIAAIVGGALFFSPGTGIRTTLAGAETSEQAACEQKAEGTLKDYRSRIDELNKSSEAIAENVRKEVKQAIDGTNQKYREASEDLNNLRNATNETWREVNKELQSSLDSLKKSYDQAQKEVLRQGSK